MKQKKIAVLVGSLRKDSWNLKMAEAFIKLAPKSLAMEIVPLGDLDMYNEDLDGKPPKSWTEFRKSIKAVDAVLFFTPEYNRSMSGVIKNAIDVGSRPTGKSIWDKKPGAVVSVSPYGMGAFGANHHLRQCMVFLNVPMMQQPEAYMGNVADYFDKKGELTNKKTLEFVKKFIHAFDAWVHTHSF